MSTAFMGDATRRGGGAAERKPGERSSWYESIAGWENATFPGTTLEFQAYKCTKASIAGIFFI